MSALIPDREDQTAAIDSRTFKLMRSSAIATRPSIAASSNCRGTLAMHTSVDFRRYLPILVALAGGALALLLAQHGYAQEAAQAAAPAAAATPAPAPVPNKGDVAWMLTSTALVLLMSVPALALFYGGLVRTKNMLSVLMQVFVVFSLITVLWCVYGYSIAFTEGNAFFGGFSRLFLNGTFNPADGSFSMAATFSKNTPLYELLYAAFQATFAAITVCLILGSIVERIKFSAVLIFAVIWFTFSYLPVAHMVWFWQGPDAYTDASKVDALNASAGYIWQMGALDFAGGTVVHINAGVAGLVGAFLLGKRVGYGREAIKPHSLTMTMIGASLLWFGWFGFNAGSALAANETAAQAFLTTNTASAAAMLSWIFFDVARGGKPTVMGACIGAVVGLVAITPAAGFVTVGTSLFIGAVSSWISNLACQYKGRTSLDDTLDVFPCHGLGGIVGMLLTGVCAKDVGLLSGHSATFVSHLVALVAVGLYTFCGSYALYAITDRLIPLRVKPDDEQAGLDLSQHGESLAAWGGVQPVLWHPREKSIPAQGMFQSGPGQQGAFDADGVTAHAG